MSLAERFARLPTAAKLLLILSAVLLPIGIALTWVGETGISEANAALEGRAQDQARAAVKGIESLIARNALALRVAANGALAAGRANACVRTQRTLSIAPAVAQSFELEMTDGKPICSIGEVGETSGYPLVAPGDIRVTIAPDRQAVAIRAGGVGGKATGIVPGDDLRAVAMDSAASIESLVLVDDQRELRLIGPPPRDDHQLSLSE